MPEKTVNIIEIVTATNIYTVGAVPAGFTDAVDKIKFFSSLEAYNKGRNFEGPCYVVYLTDGVTRRIVPLKEVKDLGVSISEKETKTKTTPPEAVAYVAGDNNDQ